MNFIMDLDVGLSDWWIEIYNSFMKIQLSYEDQ